MPSGDARDREIPWRENLESYRSLDYEFTHLRSFDSYSFAAMWTQFEIIAAPTHYPNMREPLVFRLEETPPLPVYNWLAQRYFFAPDEAQVREARAGASGGWPSCRGGSGCGGSSTRRCSGSWSCGFVPRREPGRAGCCRGGRRRATAPPSRLTRDYFCATM